MINKFKTLLVAGATAISIQAQAADHTHTNLVTLDNVQVALKVYSQAGLNTHDTALEVDATALTTTEILKDLATISGGAFTYATGDKLVIETTYSNTVYGTTGTTNGTPGFSSTFSNVTSVALGGTSSTNLTPLISGSTTNTFVLTNNDGTVEVLETSVTPTTTNTSTFSTSISNNPILYTNGVAFTNLATTDLPTTNGGTVSTAVIIAAVSNSTAVTGTNITITEVSPATTSHFTNNGHSIAVMTPASHGAAAALVPVDNWVQYETDDSSNLVAEAGKDLSDTNFSGTNITSQTRYNTADVEFELEYPTNTPTGYLNIQMDPYGFSKATTKLVNLVTGGNSKDSQVFMVDASQVINVTIGGNYTENLIGGTFTTSSTVTNDGVTNNNVFFNNSIGTNNSQNGYLTGTSNDLCGTGTITVTYIGSLTNITTDTNLP